ncbi:MAG: UPF0175 family protein [Bacteroidales bacterium]|jgi:predicted HTH domain antitoxin|nr:UPF0175 family protein [Bacteroidales bacterium]
MKTVVLNIPNESSILSTFDLSVYLATKLYEDEILSAGQAAKIAQLSKRSFLEIMGKYGVSPFSTKKEDLLEDIKNA